MADDREQAVDALVARGKLSQQQGLAMRELAKRNKLSMDVLEKGVSFHAIRNDNPLQTVGRGLARGAASMAGIVGDVGTGLSSVLQGQAILNRGLRTEPIIVTDEDGSQRFVSASDEFGAVGKVAEIAAKAPGRQDIMDVSNKAGLNLASSGSGLANVSEVVGAGLTGGLPHILRQGTLGGGARAATANVAGSLGAVTGAQVGGAVGQGLGGEEGETKGQMIGSLAGALTATVGATTAQMALKRSITGTKFRDQIVLRPGRTKKTAFRNRVDTMAEAVGKENVAVAGAMKPGEHQFIKVAEGALASVPGGVSVMKRKAQNIALGAELRLRKILGLKGVDTLERRAGMAVLDSASNRVTQLKNSTDIKYQRANKFLPEIARQQKISWTRTRKALQELAAEEAIPDAAKPAITGFSGGERMSPSQWAKQKLAILESDPFWLNGKTRYQLLNEVRKDLGENIRNDDVIAKDALHGSWKKMYGAVARDLGDGLEAVVARGKTGVQAEAARRTARTALNRANVAWRKERIVMDKILKPLLKKEAFAEEAYQALFSADLKRGSRIGQILRGSNPEQRRIIIKAFMSKMGTLTEDGVTHPNWNISRFLNNWTRANAQTRRLLFAGNPQLERNVTKFVSALSGIRDASDVLANPSGTAGRGLAAATLFYGMGALGAMAVADDPDAAGVNVAGAASMLSGLAGANILSRLMTSPVFTNWLATASAQPMTNLPKHIGRLQAIVRQSDDAVLINDIDSFVTTLDVMNDRVEERLKLDNPRALRAQ